MSGIFFLCAGSLLSASVTGRGRKGGQERAEGTLILGALMGCGQPGRALRRRGSMGCTPFAGVSACLLVAGGEQGVIEMVAAPLF